MRSFGTDVAQPWLRRSNGQTQQQQAGLINTGRNTMFAKRNAKGQFKEMNDLVRSLSTDRRTAAKRSVKAGMGIRGKRPGGGRARRSSYSPPYTNVTRSSCGQRWSTGIGVLPCS